MTLQRQSIVLGPGTVTFDSAVFYSEGDIVATPNIDTIEIMTSMYGKVDERLSDIVWDIEFTPAGEWENLSVLFPHTTPTIGSSIFGATDKNVTIQTLAGQLLTFKAGAITQIPAITLSAVKPLLGSTRLSCIGADNEAWSAAEHRASVSANAFSDTSFDPTAIKTQAYTVAWGSEAPWNNMETEEGVTIEFDMGLQDVRTDSFGLVDRRLTNLGIMARLTPVGVSETQQLSLLKIQGAGVVRGASLLNNENDLTISGTGVHVIVYNTAPKEGPYRFGQTVLRAGQLGFVALRNFTAGVADAMYYVGTAAP